MAPSQEKDTAVRVRLRYPNLAIFLEKFAPNVTRGGIFLASRHPRPVGAVIRFEVLLETGGAVLSGEGRVTWVKEFDPAAPQRPHGMGVQFIYVDPEARPVLDQLLQKKPGPSSTQPAQPAVAVERAPTSPSTPALRPRPSPEAFEEFDLGIDDALVRRAVERARVLAGRTEDVEALLNPEHEDPVTIETARAELPRLLSAARRNTGLYRTLADLARRDTAAARSTTGENGEKS